MKTPQGILVVAAGSAYRAYCNNCTWRAAQGARTIPDAQVVARAHGAKCK